MQSYRKELWFDVKQRREFINITPEVERCLAESGITEGLLLCNAMHITASVFINDDESGLHADFEQWLEGLAPEKPHSRYRHKRLRGQRRCPSETLGHGPRSCCRRHRRLAGLWPLGTLSSTASSTANVVNECSSKSSASNAVHWHHRRPAATSGGTFTPGRSVWTQSMDAGR